MNPQVDNYFVEGCGRCPLVGTPDCKVNSWRDGMLQLRAILLDCGLTEELKWKQPCYTFQGNNIVILGALKNFYSLGFFKGALLKDPGGVLTAPGQNSQAVRQIRFTKAEEIGKLESVIRAFVKEAVELEKAGRKVQFKNNPEPVPEELQQKLDEDHVFRTAFQALTPGRQRGYILYFSAPKQSKTRVSRIEKYLPRILEGKGFHDR